MHPTQLDHRLPSICDCTSRRTHWSQLTDILLEATILFRSDTSPAHRSIPHYASPKLAGLTKICSLNSWGQLGLPAMGEGTKSLGWWIRRGDDIWQEDGEKMLEAATLSPYTARAMHTAKCLTFWDAEECFTRTCTAKQMKRVIHSKYSPCWLNKRGHYNKRLGIKSTESYSHTAALLWL